jgi:hypothetical protein
MANLKFVDMVACWDSVTPAIFVFNRPQVFEHKREKIICTSHIFILKKSL